MGMIVRIFYNSAQFSVCSVLTIIAFNSIFIPNFIPIVISKDHKKGHLNKDVLFQVICFYQYKLYLIID